MFAQVPALQQRVPGPRSQPVSQSVSAVLLCTWKCPLHSSLLLFSSHGAGRKDECFWRWRVVSAVSIAGWKKNPKLWRFECIRKHFSSQFLLLSIMVAGFFWKHIFTGFCFKKVWGKYVLLQQKRIVQNEVFLCHQFLSLGSLSCRPGAEQESWVSTRMTRGGRGDSGGTVQRVIAWPLGGMWIFYALICRFHGCYISVNHGFFFFQCHVLMPRNNDVLICKYVRANHFSKWLNDNWPGFLAMLVHIQEFWEVRISNQCINCSQKQWSFMNTQLNS